MNENFYMNMLKKTAGSSAAIIITRLAIFSGSTVAGILVGRKVHETSENKAVAIGAGIGTAVVINKVSNKIAQPLYEKCVKSIYSAAEEMTEFAEEAVEDLSPEEQEALNDVKEKFENFKEAYNI